jgi:hypothetical protein
MSASEPLPLWQELIQVTAPPRRILAVTESLRFGGVQYALNPTAKAGGGSGFPFQSGFRTESTSSVVILSTGRRRRGAA